MSTIQDIYISPTAHSPEVEFKFSNNCLRLCGESFPENAKAFYAPIFDALICYLKDGHQKTINLDFDLKYFNSATTRLIYKMFEYLSNSVNDFNHIINIIIHLEEGDDMIHDFFQEMKKEYSNLNFQEKSK